LAKLPRTKREDVNATLHDEVVSIFGKLTLKSERIRMIINNPGNWPLCLRRSIPIGEDRGAGRKSRVFSYVPTPQAF
jgi:hypothetical protein